MLIVKGDGENKPPCLTALNTPKIKFNKVSTKYKSILTGMNSL